MSKRNMGVFEQLKLATADPVSLSAPIPGADDLTYEMAMPDLGPSPFDRAEINERRRIVRHALSLLPKIERQILTRRFGIGTDGPEKLDEIGKDFHRSRERIRQREMDAKAMLAAILSEMLGCPEPTEFAERSRERRDRNNYRRNQRQKEQRAAEAAI